MKIAVRVCLAGAACLGLSAVGCQTYQVDQVLPSPYHLRDSVRYFPKGPQFPHANELNSMQQAENLRLEQDAEEQRNRANALLPAPPPGGPARAGK